MKHGKQGAEMFRHANFLPETVVESLPVGASRDHARARAVRRPLIARRRQRGPYSNGSGYLRVSQPRRSQLPSERGFMSRECISLLSRCPRSVACSAPGSVESCGRMLRAEASARGSVSSRPQKRQDGRTLPPVPDSVAVAYASESDACCVTIRSRRRVESYGLLRW
jgi:hypothetical protein